MLKKFSHIKLMIILLHFTPFQFTKGFIGMLYFRIAGETSFGVQSSPDQVSVFLCVMKSSCVGIFIGKMWDNLVQMKFFSVHLIFYLFSKSCCVTI